MPKAKSAEVKYLGEDPEVAEEKEAADQKALEKELDAQSSASEREVELLRQQLAEEREKREKFEALRERYRKGDWKDLPPETPCLVTIHKGPDMSQNYPVPVTVNGDRRLIQRGVPTEIPLSHVLVLKNAQYLSPIQLINPETGKREQIMENRHRFQFDAQPIGV